MLSQETSLRKIAVKTKLLQRKLLWTAKLLRNNRFEKQTCFERARLQPCRIRAENYSGFSR
jgi:hypothetical protein